MSNKKKLVIACIPVMILIIIGAYFKGFNLNKNVKTNSTRVVQTNDSKSDKKIDNKNQVDKKDNNKKKEEDKKKENKKKEDIKKREDNKKKEEAKKKDKINTKNKNAGANTNKKVKSKDKFSEVGEKVTVNIRIEGYDKTFVPRTQITTGIFDLNQFSGPATGSSATQSKGWGINKFNNSTNAHAVIKTLEKYGYKKGSGYDLQDYGWSLYMAMIGGDREFDHRGTSGWMYRVNNILPNVGCQGRPIKNGDEILWYFGAYGFDTLVTEMKANITNVKVGKPVKITLNGVKNDVNTWKEYREPVKGAIIYTINGSPLIIDGKKFITDKNGDVLVTFNKPGTYRLSAERINKSGLKDIVRPEPVKVVVK